MLQSNRGNATVLTIIGIVSFFILLSVGMVGCPKYNVWQKGLKGEATLKEAEWDRQITIKEAEAKQQSAKSLGIAAITKAKYAAEAEIERAQGVAKANEIIGESLKGNESYLRYLWIQGLQDGSSEVIYIPTEANLPILEATRKSMSKGRIRKHN